MLMQSMSVNHITSSPHYPQSSGLAEKFVGIFKNLFHKAKEEGQSPYTALMVYRNTSLNGSLQSPMQILQGRQAHTDLPLLYAAKVKMDINHIPRPSAEILWVKDKSLSSPIHDIPIGQHVMYREPNDRRWYPATIIQQLPEKRSYLIKTNDNVIYRKTEVHLKPYTPKEKVPQPELSKIITKVLILTRGLNVILKHLRDSIYNGYMLLKNQLDSKYKAHNQLDSLYVFDVCWLTLLKMLYILPP